MPILFMQTSDPNYYYDMLSTTSKTIRRYCELNGFQYSQYVGIKRGFMGWQATYNRIFMLKELLDRGHRGWVFYLDADAYIENLDFDLRKYLSDKGKHAAIFSGHLNGIPYNINAGGFAINFDHPAGRVFVSDYYAALTSVNFDKFEHAIFWERDVIDDQNMIFNILKHYGELNFLNPFLFEKPNASYVNDGPFIKQSLRSHFKNEGERRSFINFAVEKVMNSAPSFSELRGANIASIPASHPLLLTRLGKKGDFGISHDGEDEGVVLYGPYINIEKGKYKGMVDLRITQIDVGNSGPITIEVVADHGKNQIAAVKNTLNNAGYQSLDFGFNIDEKVEYLEVRVHAVRRVAFVIVGIRLYRSNEA